MVKGTYSEWLLSYWLIFLQIRNNVANQETNSLSILFGGDISFSGIIEDEVRRKNCHYVDSFTQIKPYIDDVDMRIFNLVSPFGDTMHPPDRLNPTKESHLLANAEAISALEYIRTNAVILANNHLIDYGDESVFATTALLEDKNISYSGLTYGTLTYNYQTPLILHQGDIKIALFSYCMSVSGCGNIRNKTKIGPAVFRLDVAVNELNSIRQHNIDAVIVALNWGAEKFLVNEEYPKDVVDALQIYADVIIGSHPSLDYGHHYWNYTLIVPSLGAFLYPMHILDNAMGQDIAMKIGDKEMKAWTQYTKSYHNAKSRGHLLKLQFDGDGLVREQAKYLQIDSDINDKHCLYTRKKLEDEWKTICKNGDQQCIGDNTCNTERCRRKKKEKGLKNIFASTQSLNDIDNSDV